MIHKLIITFSVLLYAVGVPYLEISETHLFNPDWTPHMRIHQAWQLITNSSIGLLCLWLTWSRDKTMLSAVLSFMVTGGFLLAFALKDTYGGSMKFLDGTERTLLGLNIGVVGFGLVAILLTVSLFVQIRNNRKAADRPK